jgi:hypothetical protein
VEVKADPASCGGFCQRCCTLICSRCVGQKCVPFEEKLAEMERKAENDRRVHGYF